MAISENLVVEFYIVRWAYKKFHFEPFRTLEIGLRSRKSVFDMFFIVFRGEFNLGKGFFGILFKVSTTLNFRILKDMRSAWIVNVRLSNFNQINTYNLLTFWSKSLCLSGLKSIKY